MSEECVYITACHQVAAGMLPWWEENGEIAPAAWFNEWLPSAKNKKTSTYVLTFTCH